KYNSSGTKLWEASYSGAGSGPDGFTSVIVDGSGNVFAAGGYYQSSSELTNSLLVKYNSSGTQQWVVTWNNSTHDLEDAAIRVSLNGSKVVIVGATQTGTNPISWQAFARSHAISNGSL